MKEIFEAIEAQSEQATARELEEQAAAEARAREEKAAAERAYQEWLAAEKRKAAEAKRHSDWAFLIRCLFSAFWFWFCNEAIICGWMSKGFADCVFAAWMVYFLIYAGAWWQYRFGKGGVLNARAK